MIFDDALDHITRIDRVLRQPLGHLLLVGASGARKTVLSKFVSWMNGLSVPPRTTFFDEVELSFLVWSGATVCFVRRTLARSVFLGFQIGIPRCKSLYK